MYYNPTLISYKHYHFLIMAAPAQRGLRKFLKDLKKNKVELLVRCCGLTYDEDALAPLGIAREKIKFDDGMLPSDDVVNNWLKIVDDFFDAPDAVKSDEPKKVIAVHCLSGLDRAPLLVAMALAHKGMKVQVAVKVIQHERKNAISQTQECYIYE